MSGGLMQDLGVTLRGLGRKPGLPAAAVLALALGIGAVTAVFSVVDGVLLSALPYPEPDRLVVIRESNPARGIAATGAAPAKVEAWRQQARSLAMLAAVAPTTFHLTGNGEPLKISGLQVTSSYFELLGVRLLHGRSFHPEEQEYGRHRVVVLSQGLWERRFGADPAIVGADVWLNGEAHTVLGVAALFSDPVGAPDLWVPLANVAWGNRVSHDLDVIARLAEGVSVEQAGEELEVIARRLEAEYPATDAGWRVRVLPLAEALVSEVRTSLWVLLAAVGLVLAVACTSVAAVLLARALGRSRELAVRLALGAPRAAIVRLLLLESLSLATLGGLVGLALAGVGVDVFLALAPADLPHLDQVGVDARVLAFTLSAVVAAALAAGLSPILFTRRLSLTEAFKQGGAGGGAGRRLQRALGRLMIVEIALALVLLVGAGLLLKSFARLRAVDPGFEPQGVLTVDLSLARAGHGRREWEGIYQQIVERAETLPGVTAAAVVSSLPLSGSGESFRLLLDGETGLTAAEQPTAEVRAVSADYFRALGIPLRTGRFPRPERDGRVAGVAVNEALVRRFWPGGGGVAGALGHRLSIDGPEGPWMPVAGVVGDVRDFGLDQEPTPEFYLPLEGFAWPSMTLLVRTDGDPSTLVPALRAAVWEVDPNLPASEVRTLESLLAASVAGPRFQLALLGLFAMLALVLTAVGLAGTMVYSVRLRSHEIGVRMSLGAGRSHVLGLVLGQACRLALVGVAVGVAAAFALTRLLRGLLFQVRPSDPAVFILVALALALVVLVAAALPAWRAARVEPVTALRHSAQ